MKIEKYQQMLYKQMNEKLTTWNELPFITEQEIYNFLHALKGTTGSIGLNELSDIVSEKLDFLNGTSEQLWSKSEWQKYLEQLIEIVSFYQTNISLQQEKLEFPSSSQQNILNQEFILIIDDDFVFISYLKNILEDNGYSVVVASDGERGLELIYEIKPTMVFIDIMLPDISGYSILKSITKLKKNYMIVTVISANHDKENRIRAYEMGALDFISKPIDKEILLSYVKNRLAFKKEIEYSIIIDELTQVYNRKFLESQFEKLIQQYRRKNEPFSVVVLDLDYFKKVNDTYGHLVGDEVLKGLAALVTKLKREQDIFCRYGGEEFVMLMPQTSAEDSYILVERFREAMEQRKFEANGVQFYVTFSAGIVGANATNLHPKKLLEEADQALYVAKKSGRNRTEFFGVSRKIVYKKLKITLIVIDDVFIIRNLVTNHFNTWNSNENFDIEVMEFSDGMSFLKSDWYNPDSKYVILLDGIMPKMDGIGVLKEIRSKHTSNDVIVSMLTSRSDESDVLEAIEYGADDYIMKPFNITNVSNRILNLINQVFLK